MSAQHTPGPWHWQWHENSPEKDLAQLYAGEKLICCFGNDEQYYPTAGIEPSKQDAALIAAAPDVLMALKYCRNAIVGGQLIKDSRGEIYHQQFGKAFIDFIDAAISKATWIAT